MVIMDTIYGGNLANAPQLQDLHPKALGCTLVHIFAPCTDKVHPKEYWKSLGYQLDKLAKLMGTHIFNKCCCFRPIFYSPVFKIPFIHI